MLYNGEQIGDGSPPEVDIAVDPLEGTRLTARGMPSALAVIALVRARHDVRPRALRLHGEARRRPRGRRLPQPRRAAPGRDPRSPSAKGTEPGDVTVIVLDRPRHEEQIEAIREAGARIRLITDGDVSAALFAVSAEGRRRPALGDRRHPGGGASPPPRSSASAARSSAGCGRATTTSARPRSTPATTSTRSSTSTAWSPATTSSSPPPGSPTASCSQGVRYTARQGLDRVAGDALSLGHRAHRAGPPRPGEAARGRRRALRLRPSRARSSQPGRRTPRSSSRAHRSRRCRAARAAAR